MKNFVLILLIVGIFFVAASQSIAQCSCEPNRTFDEHFRLSDAVFVGKVIEAKHITRESDESDDVVVIEFEVKITWKRDLSKYVKVKEYYGSTKGFEPTAMWLLYALENADGTFEIVRGCCSKTTRLSDALQEGHLKAFKQMGEKPKKIIKSECGKPETGT